MFGRVTHGYRMLRIILLGKPREKLLGNRLWDLYPGNAAKPHRYKKDGRWYLGASPSKKAVARIKEKVGNLLIPSNTGTWEEVRDRLNQILRGWSAYFSYGTRAAAYGAVHLSSILCKRRLHLRDYPRVDSLNQSTLSEEF